VIKAMVMIVDDNEPIRGFIKEYVKQIVGKDEFYECSDGLEAVDAYQRIRPEWVLMDIKLPGMDGLAATRKIVEQSPEARIIMVTNFDDLELRNAAQANGARGYVLKERLFELRELMR
jgi:DNA-binding NarL/FixJ family response regulator